MGENERWGVPEGSLLHRSQTPFVERHDDRSGDGDGDGDRHEAMPSLCWLISHRSCRLDHDDGGATIVAIAAAAA